MKHTLLKHVALIGSACLLPTLASAHPGHFALDPTVAPHPGHEGAVALLLFGLFSLAGLVIHRWIEHRR